MKEYVLYFPNYEIYKVFELLKWPFRSLKVIDIEYTTYMYDLLLAFDCECVTVLYHF